MKNIVVLAPHPDDEILTCYSIIKKAAATDRVWIVIVTNGDRRGREMASIRVAESFTALSKLGTRPNQIIVMGYGDTGMSQNNSFLYRLYHLKGSDILPSLVSNQTYHPILGSKEWHYKMQGKHGDYSRSGFLHDLERIFLHCKPGEVYVSSRYDLHGDHIALYHFTMEVIKKMKTPPLVMQYIVHGDDRGHWPTNASYFECPPVCDEEIWGKRVITKVDAAEKKALIEIFQSQLTQSDHLLNFAKNEEVFIN